MSCSVLDPSMIASTVTSVRDHVRTYRYWKSVKCAHCREARLIRAEVYIAFATYEV